MLKTMTDYSLLTQQLLSLSEGVEEEVTVLANAASLLWHSLPGINWAGFYLARENGLVLGPFMGRPACVRIPCGKGVCGTAAERDETLLVPDVHRFPGHIACDSASNAEIVVPIHTPSGRLFGVLDIDSPVLGRFTIEDREGLEAFVKALENSLRGTRQCS